MKNLSYNAAGEEAVESTAAAVAIMQKYPNNEQLNAFISETQQLNAVLADVNTKVMYDHNLDKLAKDLNQRFFHFRKIVECNLISDDEGLKSAAAALSAVVEANNHITSVGRVKKTGAVVAFLNDLEEATAKQAVAKLHGLPECVAGIRAAADKLTAELRSDMQQTAASKTVKASEVKKQLLTVFNEKLLKTLFAYSIIAPADYKTEYDEVQGLVNEYNEIIRRRQQAGRRFTDNPKKS
ncbi:MAG: DUF6261 family protein [Bacteroidales bacterium]|nr:DUF6261 family protein [Bacteroidales bacterium]